MKGHVSVTVADPQRYDDRFLTTSLHPALLAVEGQFTNRPSQDYFVASLATRVIGVR